MTWTRSLTPSTSCDCAGLPDVPEAVNTMSQFLDHLADDAMPALIDRLAAVTNQSELHRRYRLWTVL